MGAVEGQQLNELRAHSSRKKGWSLSRAGQESKAM